MEAIFPAGVDDADVAEFKGVVEPGDSAAVREPSVEEAMAGEVAEAMGYSSTLVTNTPNRTRMHAERAKRQEEVISAEMAATTELHMMLAVEKQKIRSYQQARIEARKRGLPPPPRPAILNDFISQVPDPFAMVDPETGKSLLPKGWVGHWCSVKDVDGNDNDKSVREYQRCGYQEVKLPDGTPLMTHQKAMMAPGHAYAKRMLQRASNPLMENDQLMGKLDDMAESYNSSVGRRAVSLFVSDRHDVKGQVERG